MNNFIADAAKKIYSSDKDYLNSVLVVFRSRRAGLYFRKELSKLIEKPIWSPSVMSINEFISSFSKLELADRLTLVFELYKSYLKHFPDESFDEFYSWGDMLVRDFDEIDKHLVDASLLFKKLRDEKVMETLFPAEINEDAKNFWGSLLKVKSGNQYAENFLNIWNSLYDIYSAFKESLVARGIAYEGLAVRDIADRVINTADFDSYKKIYFVGFNFINKCEQKIISALKEKGKVEIFWDADKYYLHDENQEAGKFIRKFHKSVGGEIILPSKSLSESAKHIEVCGSPLNSGMVKAFGARIGELIETDNIKPENTLVLVPEPSGLLPVLYALPEKAEKINVTMGLPLKSTPLFNLVSGIHKLHTGKIFEDGKVKYYYGDVVNVLMHPYIKFTSPKEVFAFVRKVREDNIVYIDVFKDLIPEMQSESAKILLSMIFSLGSDVSEIVSGLNSIINSLAVRMESGNDSEENYKLFQLEYLYNFSTQLNRLADSISVSGIELNSFTFWNMLIQVLNSANVVFTGEPLKGLQVMGLLETRNLSFENVFMLYMNEGSMPDSSESLSFIPYSLRKGFGMPVYEDSDAMNAYNFWSLVQKADNVYLFYNTDTGNEVKEKSRYILQIEKELVPQNPGIAYTRSISAPSGNAVSENIIVIPKTPELNDFMLERIKRLSPTYLSNFINCSLQFYLQKVLGLREDEEVEEVFSIKTFGTVFHGVMQELYKPYVGKEVTNDTIDTLILLIRNNFDKVFNNFISSETKLSNVNFTGKGRNLLYKSIIKDLVIKLLGKDKERAPFKIKALEKEIYGNIKIEVNGIEREIKIGGIADRIDEKNGVNFVLDYKTGNAVLKKLDAKTFDKFWQELPVNNNYKTSLQTMLYAYILHLEDPKSKYNAGLYPVKKLNSGINLISDSAFSEIDFERFGSALKHILSEIFNTDVPFSQTDDPEKCKYCDFQSLCGR